MDDELSNSIHSILNRLPLNAFADMNVSHYEATITRIGWELFLRGEKWQQFVHAGNVFRHCSSDCFFCLFVWLGIFCLSSAGNHFLTHTQTYRYLDRHIQMKRWGMRQTESDNFHIIKNNSLAQSLHLKLHGQKTFLLRDCNYGI